MKPGSNATTIKKELHSIIQAIGGLGDSAGDDVDGDETGEGDDIDIPIPSFETMDSDDEDTTDAQMNDVKSSKNKIIPDIDEITIGEPRDKSDPYGSGFKNITDLKESLDIKDYSILAFKLSQEEFEVVEPIEADE